MINLKNMFICNGNLVRDPEVSKTAKGDSKCKFCVSHKKDGINATGYNYFNFIATGKNADLISKYFKKGSPISLISQYSSFETVGQNGEKKYSSIFFVDSITFVPKDFSENNGNNNGNRNYTQTNNITNEHRYSQSDTIPYNNQENTSYNQSPIPSNVTVNVDPVDTDGGFDNNNGGVDDIPF